MYCRGPHAAMWRSAAYIVALLHDGFKLGMHERRLRFTNYVEDPQGHAMDVDWTLGRHNVAVTCVCLSVCSFCSELACSMRLACIRLQ